MSQKVEIRKWGSKNFYSLKLTIERTERHHEYYRCFSVIDANGERKMLWKLVGAANPFISLFDQFKLYAIPTEKIISKPLIAFIVRCLKSYRQSANIKTFKVEFYHVNLPEQQHKVKEELAINKIISLIEGMSEEELNRFAQQFQSLDINENKYAVQECSFYEQQVKQNLNKIAILPQMQKMKRLENMCKILYRTWRTELFYDSKTAEVYIVTESFRNSDEAEFFTLQQLLFINKKNQILQVDEQFIEDLCCDLIKKLIRFEQNNLNQEQVSSYRLNFETIFVEAKKDENNELIIIPSSQIDFMQPFIEVLELKPEISSIEGFLIFHSTPKQHCFNFNFADTLKDNFNIKDELKLKQIQIAIRWLLIADHLFISILERKKQSIIQVERDRKNIINALIHSGHKSRLHQSTITLINLLKLNCSMENSNQILGQFTLQKIQQNYHQQQEKESSTLLSSHRYALIQSSIELKTKLFFGEEGLKYFFEKNKQINGIGKQGKYMALYLLTNYAILQSERQFLQLWTGEQVKLLDENNPLAMAIKKFNNITPKIQKYVEEIEKDTSKWEAMEEKMKSILLFCKKIKGKSFGSSIYNINFKDRQAKLKEIQKLVDQTKKNIELLVDETKKDFKEQINIENNNSKVNINHIIGRKNICLMKIYLALNFYNYSQLFCEYLAINSSKPALSSTKLQINNEYNKIEKRIQKLAGRKAAEFYQQLHVNHVQTDQV